MALKALTLNTPAADKAHIFAEDDAAIYQSIIGNDGVFDIGEKFKTTVISNNKVRVGNGVLNVQGHIARTVYGDYTDMTIENGVSGKNRNDLIVAKFTVGSDSDTFVLEVKKGVAGTTATDPAVTKGDLYNGSKVRELPLWRVKIENLSIVKVEQMFTVNATNKGLLDKINEFGSEIGTNYIKYANGLLIQWGSATHGAYMTVRKDVTLPLAYKDTSYEVLISPARNCNVVKNYWVADEAGNTRKTTKGFSFSSQLESNSSVHERDFYWTTIGK